MPDDVRALVGTCYAPAPNDRPAFAAITHTKAPRAAVTTSCPARDDWTGYDEAPRLRLKYDHDDL